MSMREYHGSYACCAQCTRCVCVCVTSTIRHDFTLKKRKVIIEFLQFCKDTLQAYYITVTFVLRILYVLYYTYVYNILYVPPHLQNNFLMYIHSKRLVFLLSRNGNKDKEKLHEYISPVSRANKIVFAEGKRNRRQFIKHLGTMVYLS